MNTRLTAIARWGRVAQAALSQMQPLISDVAITPGEESALVPIFVHRDVFEIVAHLSSETGLSADDVIRVSLLESAQRRGIALPKPS